LTSLDEDRPALRRAWYGEGSARAKPLALKIEAANFEGIGENTGLSIRLKRVVLPGIPMAEDNFHKFLGAIVAEVVGEHFALTEVGRLRVV
jgi:hypothetical protein